MAADPKDKSARQNLTPKGDAAGKRTEGATALDAGLRNSVPGPGPASGIAVSPPSGSAAAAKLQLVPAASPSFYMDPASRQFGAWRLDDEAQTCPVKFSLFFPDRTKDPGQFRERPEIANYGDPRIKSIHVIGTFQEQLGQTNWTKDDANALQREENSKGFSWTFTTKPLKAGFYEYKYLVTFLNGQVRIVSDPCSRYGGEDVKNQNSAFVIGPSPEPDVTPLAARQPVRDLVIYELNIDDFTDELRYSSEATAGRAALDAIVPKLDYLQQLGVNAILFLPWTAWADDYFSWGYTPYQYFSVEHRYTNDVTDTSPNHETRQLSRLRELITECHNRGIHVIMDGVFNHVGPDTSANYSGFAYRWLYENPDASPYVGTFGGTFPGLKDLDYYNGCTQEFIRDVCFYWMDEFKIDGIRLDNTLNFYIPGVDNGLPRLLRDVAGHTNDQNFSLTLEHIDISAAQVTNATSASSYWNNGQYETAFQYLWEYQISPKLLRMLDSHAGLNDGKVATTYLTNHDHSHVAWQTGAKNDDGSMEWYRTQPGAIALFTSPGAPMIANGQEFGEDHWIPEDDHNSGRRVKPRPLRWEFLADPIGKNLNDLYHRLIEMRKANPALRSDNFYPPAWNEGDRQFNSAGYGVDAQKQVLIYHRWGNDEHGTLQRFIVVLNFSQSDQFVDVPFSTGGLWTDLLNPGISFSLNDPWQRNWKVSSNWGNVFLHQG